MVLACAIWACQQNKDTAINTDDTSIINEFVADAGTEIIAADSVSLKQQSIPYISKDDDTLIYSIDVVYPKLKVGNDPAIGRINEYIANLPLAGLLRIIKPKISARELKNLGEVASLFFKTAGDTQKAIRNARGRSYNYEAKGNVLLISQTMISLRYDEYTYTGGFHGDNNTYFLNFDASKGVLLDRQEFVKDTLALNKLAEVKFRENEIKVAKEAGTEFSIDDYFFPENKFILPKNIAITREGLHLLYNPYEVAPWVRGFIGFHIPWQELKGIVVEKYAGK